MLQEAQTFFQNFLQKELTANPLHIWTHVAVPSCWLGTRVSSTFEWVTAWIWLLATLFSIIPTDLYYRVSIMIYGAVGWLPPCLDWKEIDKLRLWLFGAVVDYWLDGQSTVPTANTDFLSASTGSLAALTFRYSARWVAPFLALETDGACEEWLPNRSASCWDVWCKGTGGGVLTLHAGLLINAGAVVNSSSEVVDGNEYFTHWEFRFSTRLSSGREKPWKEPHPISLTHLRQDLPKGGVHLLSHPGALVFLSLNHPESLVLIPLARPSHWSL